MKLEICKLLFYKINHHRISLTQLFEIIQFVKVGLNVSSYIFVYSENTHLKFTSSS